MTESEIVALAKKAGMWEFKKDTWVMDVDHLVRFATLLMAQQKAEPATIPVVFLRHLIADDGYAVGFQSMGQYRTALLAAIDRKQEPARETWDSFAERYFSQGILGQKQVPADHHAELEREHLGNPNKRTGIYADRLVPGGGSGPFPIIPVADQSDEQAFESVMRQWDYWRKRVADGDRTSAPRDWFESILAGRQSSRADREDAAPSENLHIRIDWKGATNKQVITNIELEHSAYPSDHVASTARVMYHALDAAIAARKEKGK